MMTQRLTGFALAMVLLGGLATGCSRPRSPGPEGSGADNPQVTAADGVLCDLTRTLATPSITVHCLLSGEDDPHTFSMSPDQLARLEQSDLVLINGFNLTPAMATLAEQGRAVAVAEAIDLQPLDDDSLSMAGDHDEHGHSKADDHGDHAGHEDHASHDDHGHKDDHGHQDEHAMSHGDSPSPDPHHDDHHDDHHGHDHGGVDPHVWHSPEHTQAMAMVITRELIQLVPNEESALEALNREAIAVLKDMDTWTRQQVETVPPEQRVLATRHRAFGYYAQRYGFRELPILDSFSTTEALRPAALSKLRHELDEANVVVLFPEQIPPGRSLEVIAEQTGIPLSLQPLIADGLAPGRSTVETFVSNTCAISKGLQGQCDEAEGQNLVNRWRALEEG